ncbi:MAG: helix-turn-helix transcriptional regulator [Lachnospiraceae bacterium]|nr:helix-turn-helix transcriptional regulator [Lachnospiraceae bacterium]
MIRKHLSILTGIHPNTLGDLYREDEKTYIWTLDKIYQMFECDISDVLEYVPENKKSEV